MKIAVVGATGIVGETFLDLIQERHFPVSELRLFASAASEGKDFRGHRLQVLKDGCFDGLDLVFFSSGNDISAEWAPKAVAAGAFAIDNSSAFRLNPEVPLIVPEVNGSLLPSPEQPTLIANPNCSTIQMVVALAPLHKAYGLTSVRVSTYQSASGAGRDGIAELREQFGQISREEDVKAHVFSAPLAENVIPQIGSFEEDGFSTEERKLMFETQKILGAPELPVSAFAVRVPTPIGHAESVWLSLNETVEREELLKTLRQGEGLVVQDPDYPLVSECAQKNPVYVGRIHRDLYDPKSWLMWIVADNVRKGAALNGLQIAEAIFDISAPA